MRLAAILASTAMLTVPAARVRAQELIVNGHFNTDINGWTLVGEGSQVWDPLDWQSNPASGSLRLTNTSVAANQPTVSGQCIPLAPSGTYEVGGHVRFPSGQASFGAAAIGVAWFDDPSCAVTPLSTVNTPLVASTTTNTWVESFSAAITAPAGTVAVGVGPAVVKTLAGGSLTALFDRVRFGPTGTTPVRAQGFTVE
jgi:hypothetical protein